MKCQIIKILLQLIVFWVYFLNGLRHWKLILYAHSKLYEKNAGHFFSKIKWWTRIVSSTSGTSIMNVIPIFDRISSLLLTLFAALKKKQHIGNNQYHKVLFDAVHLSLWIWNTYLTNIHIFTSIYTCTLLFTSRKFCVLCEAPSNSLEC